MLGVERNSLGPQAPTQLFRMLVSEYITLREIDVKPIVVALAAPSVLADLDFLVESDLATWAGPEVMVSPRGKGLLGVQPYSWSAVVVSFDLQSLGW